MVHFLQERYGLDNKSSVIRFLIRKAAREAGYPTTRKEEPRSEKFGDMLTRVELFDLTFSANLAKMPW